MPPSWDLVGPARWLEWVLGAVAVEAFVAARKRASAAEVAVGLAILSVAVVVDPYADLLPLGATLLPWRRALHDSFVGVACFVIVTVSCRRGLGSPGVTHALGRLLAHMGMVSYSLYLVHGPVMSFAHRAARACGVESVGGLMVARLGAALFVAEAFHRLVERRFLTRVRTEAPPRRE
jgi:peptidoglycan/LPS O-acetylase OafA/YrhL